MFTDIYFILFIQLSYLLIDATSYGEIKIVITYGICHKGVGARREFSRLEICICVICTLITVTLSSRFILPGHFPTSSNSGVARISDWICIEHNPATVYYFFLV